MPARSRQGSLASRRGGSGNCFPPRCRPAALVSVFGGEALHQFNDPAAHLLVGNSDEGAVELKSFRAGAEVDREDGGRIFREAAVSGPLGTGQILEEEG